jgi:hypothetical protein
VGQRRWVIAVVVLSLSFVLPAAICLGLAFAQPRSQLDLVAAALAGAIWMGLLVLANWWEFTSLWLRWVWVAVLAFVLALRLLVDGGLHSTAALSPFGLVSLAAAAVGGWLLTGAVGARRHPGEAVDLTVPFSAGRFVVTDGGDGARSFLINYHYGFGRHRASGVARSMRYAMDVVETGSLGGEARGFLPRRNEAYRIWGRSLLAPCDGVVAHVEDGVEDNAAFGTQRPYGVGNHVVIRAGTDVYVVLGHLRHGSVCVARGDPVQAGDRVGAVGNSGWTERPHLHLQAARSPTGDWWHGEPVPVRFGGRFLVRNQSFGM